MSTVTDRAAFETMGRTLVARGTQSRDVVRSVRRLGVREIVGEACGDPGVVEITLPASRARPIS